jgi:hypothetical protein
MLRTMRTVAVQMAVLTLLSCASSAAEESEGGRPMSRTNVATQALQLPAPVERGTLSLEEALATRRSIR